MPATKAPLLRTSILALLLAPILPGCKATPESTPQQSPTCPANQALPAEIATRTPPAAIASDAPWIAPPADLVAEAGWFCYRCQFDLSSVPAGTRATLIAPAGRLRVNGKEFALRKTDAEMGIELSGALQPGRNTVALLAADPRAIQFDLGLSQNNVTTGPDWRVRRHPGYRVPRCPYCYWYDARDDLGPWHTESYDASHWPKPSVADRRIPASTEVGPVRIAPVSGLKSYASVRQLPQPDGSTIVVGALERTVNTPRVCPWLKVDAPAGQRVEIVLAGQGREWTIVYETRHGLQQYEFPLPLPADDVRYHLPPGVELLDLKYR